MFLYLRDLEELGLIALGRGLSARLLVETPIQWNFDGPLKPLFETTNKNFIGWAITHLEREATFVSFSRRMRPETAEMVRREAEELAERAKLLAHHDQHTTPEDQLTGYKWTFAFGATPFPAIMLWVLAALRRSWKSSASPREPALSSAFLARRKVARAPSARMSAACSGWSGRESLSIWPRPSRQAAAAALIAASRPAPACHAQLRSSTTGTSAS